MIGAIALGGGLAFPLEGQRAVEQELPVEASLARAAARGDRSAFARLVEMHKRVVYGLCLRLLQDAEEARDAAQETFVRAWSAIGTYDPTQPFAPWLLRIARNHCIDLVRALRLQIALGCAALGLPLLFALSRLVPRRLEVSA